MSQKAQIALALGMFAIGAVVGALSRWGPARSASADRRDARIEQILPPLSGWFALVFPVVLPPVSIGMMMLFC